MIIRKPVLLILNSRLGTS